MKITAGWAFIIRASASLTSGGSEAPLRLFFLGGSSSLSISAADLLRGLAMRRRLKWDACCGFFFLSCFFLIISPFLPPMYGAPLPP
jgi:hypothetical protein